MGRGLSTYQHFPCSLPCPSIPLKGGVYGWRGIETQGDYFYDITTHLESFGCLLTCLPIEGKPLMSNTVGFFPECHVEVCFGKNRLQRDRDCGPASDTYRCDRYLDSDIVQPP